MVHFSWDSLLELRETFNQWGDGRGGVEREKEKYSLSDVFSTGNFSSFLWSFVLFIIYFQSRSLYQNAAVGARKRRVAR